MSWASLTVVFVPFSSCMMTHAAVQVGKLYVCFAHMTLLFSGPFSGSKHSRFWLAPEHTDRVSAWPSAQCNTAPCIKVKTESSPGFQQLRSKWVRRPVTRLDCSSSTAHTTIAQNHNSKQLGSIMGQGLGLFKFWNNLTNIHTVQKYDIKKGLGKILIRIGQKLLKHAK